MGFSLTPKYSQIVTFDGLTKDQFLSITLKATEKLGWNLVKTNEAQYVCYSKAENYSTNIEFLILPDSDSCEFYYNNSYKPIREWAKAKNNVLRLIENVAELKNLYFQQENTVTLDESSQTNSNEFKQQDLSEIKFSLTDKIKNFFSIFIPTREYYITPIIVNINLLIFIMMVLSGVSFINPDGESLLKWGGNFRAVTLNGEYWRLLTSCFVHIGVFHLLMNMYALVYIGAMLEPFLGKAKFLTAYLLTGLFASLTSIWWHDFTVSAGASGAIFGMYGFFISLLSTNIVDSDTRTALLPSILFFTGYNLLFGMQGNIDNAAHIGGLLSGIVLGFTFIYSLKRPESKNVSYSTVGLSMVVSLILITLLCRLIPNDIATYDKRMQDEFVSMEAKGMSFYSLPQNSSNEVLLANIQDTALFYWGKNKDLVVELDKLELPQEIHLRNVSLVKYCDLRIQSFELIYKAIKENTNSYDSLITNCNNELEILINHLK